VRSPRILIAVLVAVFGFLSYLGYHQFNPYTGTEQHIAMSQEQEIALGLQSAPEMAQQMGGLDPDESVQAGVRQIGERIVQQSRAGETPYKFEFHVLADPQTVNAFALPGGPVFITRGLLVRLKNEAQLAGVLAHEISHVVARHTSEQMAKTQLGQQLVGAVDIATSDERSGHNAAMLAAVAAQMLQLRYSRHDETQADTLGVRFMSEAGYDPQAMVAVMEILKEASGGSGQPEFMSTHPDPGNREEVIRAAIARRFPDGVPSDLTLGRPIELSNAQQGE
jgi:predicted Zn-dependent protease